MIKDKLIEQIKQYCELNEIEDVDSFINKVLTRGFTSEKWGELTPKKKTKEQKAEEEGDDYVPGGEKVIEDEDPIFTTETFEEMEERCCDNNNFGGDKSGARKGKDNITKEGNINKGTIVTYEDSETLEHTRAAIRIGNDIF